MANADESGYTPHILSGKMLLDCATSTKIQSWQNYYCTGFLHGMMGGIRSERTNQDTICLPKAGPSARAFYESFESYAKEHPEVLELRSRDAVYEIFKFMYPCQSF